MESMQAANIDGTDSLSLGSLRGDEGQAREHGRRDLPVTARMGGVSGMSLWSLPGEGEAGRVCDSQAVHTGLGGAKCEPRICT